MIISILIAVIANLALIGSVLWSVFVRKLGKTRIRFFTILGALIVSIITTVVLRIVVFNERLLPWIGIKFSAEITELLEVSPSLMQVALGAVAGLITPLLFLVIFLVANFISWIVYLIISMVRAQKMKQKDATARYGKVRALILAVVQSLIILVVWLIPISVYASLAPTVMEEISAAGVFDEEGGEVFDSVLEDYVKPIDNNVMIGVFRVMGGDLLSDAMTSFKVNDESVQLEDEVDSIASLASDIICLVQNPTEEYGEAEKAAVQGIADSFQQSAVLSVIASEVTHAATDAWRANDSFIGVEKADIYIDESGLFDDFTDSLILVVNQDSAPGKEDALCDDFSTVASLVATMIDKGVFANLDNEDGLLDALSEDGVISSMVTDLGENNSMKVLIPEITNIGVHAISETMEIAEDADALYENMNTSIAEGLNAAKRKYGEAQLLAVTETLELAFDEAGVRVNEDLIEGYAAAMIDCFVAPSGSVDAQDVRAFFVIYSWNSMENTDSASANGATLPLAQQSKDRTLLVGTVFEGISDEELAYTAPALLAQLTDTLYELSGTEDETARAQIRAQARLVLQIDGFYQGLNQAGKEAFENAIAQAMPDANEVYAASALDSAASLRGHTDVVTVDQLLVDVDEAAKKINHGTVGQEAAAIESIFQAAQTLADESDQMGEMELETIGESIGDILNSLKSTETYRTRTDLLFTAIMQSESVRDSAELDMMTATLLAESGSEGENPDYKQTFKALFKTVDILEAMSKNDGELTDAQIEEMIREINPQSAAMIDTYITPTRMEENYEVPAEYSGTAAPLFSNMFGYMGSEEAKQMSDEQYQKESVAMNNILTLTMTARDNMQDDEYNDSLFGEDGVLGKDARTTVDDLMASQALASSMEETDYERDPFELSDIMSNNEETEEAKEFEDALRDHYTENRTGDVEQDAELKQNLGNLADLFGVSDIDTILSEG
ncbi:MAG: hypothetical protein IJW30_06250 [Clostridia bacterium]|nr:hypothetical protein [Clostridia bacterium]MBQ9774248.1 hypothetical protein [Clostridia bacterium]